MKFSEGDTFKMTDIRKEPNSVFKHAAASRRPVLVTNNSRKEIRKVAVVQSVEEYEAAGKERAFMRAVVKGLLDVEEEHEVSLADVRSRLGLE